MDKKTSKLLNQAKGSVEKVHLMLENDRACYTVVQQINAAQGLLEKAKANIIRRHLDDRLENIVSGERGSMKEIYKLFGIK